MRLDPVRCQARIELQYPMQQSDQAFAIGMQEAEVARLPKTFRQHMLQHPPQKLRAGYGSVTAAAGMTRGTCK